MAVPTSANYVFLPWVRQGAASGIQTPDMSANQAGVVSVPVKLRVNNTPPDIERPVRLYGPGDVTGIDPQQVVRTEPRHLAVDFEPNYFPAVEFDSPDFPWLFTPARADDAGRLRPWLCLVVVQKQEGVTLRADRNLPLPALEIGAPARPGRELPDLSESWAWAHAQVTGRQRNAEALQAGLKGDPALTVSRLLCPRRLDPATEYLACVVPAFELGRKAGLGQPITPADEQKLEPAWASGAQSPAQVTLPVYFHWEFRTGTGGDFEELVRLLEARDPDDMPPEVGKRRMDISRPGFRITPPLPTDTTLELEGALRLFDAPTTEWPEGTRMPFRTGLKKILDAPWEAMKLEGKDPVVAPPIYGRWQAARHTVETTPAPPASVTWLDELNLDPRHRAVAALGTRVVQAQQEQLMAAAWEQLGEIERINQLRRQAQLGRAVNDVYHARHFNRFSEETLLKVLAPAQSRVAIAETVDDRSTTMLLSRKISRSAIPARAVSAPLRRLTSPRGVISTRFQPVGAPPIAIVAQLNTSAPVVAARRIEGGLVTINQVTEAQTGPSATQLKQGVHFDRIFNALMTAPQLGDFTIVAEGLAPKRSLLTFTPPGSPDSAEARAFRDAAKAHQSYLIQSTTVPFLLAPPSPLDMPTTRETLLRSVDPEKTITARVRASLGISGGAEAGGDPLGQILDAPDFPQPMYEAVRDLSQDLLFPGLEQVPANTATLLETNPRFVESFLVGLNTEMGRELLWRNYPTDQRGTYFRRFWDTSAGDDRADIDTIDGWGDRELGQNASAGEQLVLLIRGELLRRYPNSVIYAVAAVREGGRLKLSSDPEHELPPLFRGTLEPDVTFLGFDLRKEKAVADPGWFFVIQQQPTEPRFGLDVADFDKPLPAPAKNDLSWRHLAGTEEELKALSHASVKTALPDIDGAKWGRSSAHQAYITLQRPVRIAIHASEMIGQE